MVDFGPAKGKERIIKIRVYIWLMLSSHLVYTLNNNKPNLSAYLIWVISTSRPCHWNVGQSAHNFCHSMTRVLFCAQKRRVSRLVAHWSFKCVLNRFYCTYYSQTFIWTLLVLYETLLPCFSMNTPGWDSGSNQHPGRTLVILRSHTGNARLTTVQCRLECHNKM